MGMDEVMIGAILQALCACAGTEAHGKQLRLQRVCIGLAAYFASEQMGADSLVGSGIDQVMIQVLTNFAGEATTTQLCCVIINSIAMTSGDMYEGIKTKELISALKTVSDEGESLVGDDDDEDEEEREEREESTGRDSWYSSVRDREMWCGR